MCDFTDSLKLQEYISLRQEIAQNYRYVFERPLLIIAAIGAIALQVEEHGIYLYFLPFILIFLLFINYWFTFNRLQSTARIIAYIQVVLEQPKATNYIGWEKSLRKYRIWMEEHTPSQKEEIITRNCNHSANPRMTFLLPPIYWFHFGMVSLVYFVSIYIMYLLLEKAEDLLLYLSFLLTIIAGLFFYYYFFVKYSREKLKGNIERERAIWVDVLPSSCGESHIPQ